MYTTVNGYYDGTSIVLKENISLKLGQNVMVTILPLQQKSKKNIDLSKYIVASERGQHVEEYMREMRDNDRI